MIQYPWLISLQFLSVLSVMLGPNLIVTITMCKKKFVKSYATRYRWKLSRDFWIRFSSSYIVVSNFRKLKRPA